MNVYLSLHLETYDVKRGKVMYTVKRVLIKYQRVIVFLFVFLLFMYSFLSFSKSVFTGDIKVFMAVANQVKYQDGNFLQRIFESWDMKGVLHRGLMYSIYSIVNNVSSAYQTDKSLFQYLAKAVYGVITIGICYVSAFLLKRKFKKDAYYIFMMTMLFSIMLLGNGIPNHLQAEMSIITIMFLSLVLLIYDSPKTDIVCGVLLSSIFFFKSICVLMIFSFFAGYIFLKKNISGKRVKYIVFSLIVSTLFLLILTAIVYPREFIDMMEASKFQSTLLSRGSPYSLRYMQTNFENHFMEAAIMVPILLPGIVILVMQIIEIFKERNFHRLTPILLLWFFPILIIIISNQYFIYHYYLLVYPAIIMIISMIQRIKFHKKMVGLGIVVAILVYIVNVIVSKGDQSPFDFLNISVYNLILACLLLYVVIIFFQKKEISKYYEMFLIFTLSGCFFFTYFNFSGYHSSYMIRQRELEEMANAKVKDFLNFYPEIEAADETLFLDAGVIPFYIDNPSYSKYVYNLPLQRYRSISQGNWKSHEEELQKLMEYDGRFIVWIPWFKLELYPEFKEKIESEYHIFSESLVVHSADWSFIDLTNIDSIGSGDCAIIYEANSYTTAEDVK